MSQKASQNKERCCQALIDIALRSVSDGLNQGTAGNFSVRHRDGMLITPSAVPYEQLTPSQIVMMGLDGKVVGGKSSPSSEWRFHADIYREQPSTHAVVHLHSPWATSLACQRREIPAFHYMVALAGGDSIPCARYETFGTPELSQAVIIALQQRKACLMANHGQLSVGDDLHQAYVLATEVENLARMYGQSLSCGEPQILSKQQMHEALAQFAAYRAGKLHHS